MYVVGDQLLLRDEYLYRLEDSELKIEPYKMIKYTQDVINVSGDQLFFKQINENNTYIYIPTAWLRTRFANFRATIFIFNMCTMPMEDTWYLWTTPLQNTFLQSNSFKTFYSGVSAVKLVDSSLFF